jgi:hypothetical protein
MTTWACAGFAHNEAAHIIACGGSLHASRQGLPAPAVVHLLTDHRAIRSTREWDNAARAIRAEKGRGPRAKEDRQAHRRTVGPCRTAQLSPRIT